MGAGISGAAEGAANILTTTVGAVTEIGAIAVDAANVYVAIGMGANVNPSGMNSQFFQSIAQAGGDPAATNAIYGNFVVGVATLGTVPIAQIAIHEYQSGGDGTQFAAAVGSYGFMFLIPVGAGMAWRGATAAPKPAPVTIAGEPPPVMTPTGPVAFPEPTMGPVVVEPAPVVVEPVPVVGEPPLLGSGPIRVTGPAPEPVAPLVPEPVGTPSATPIIAGDPPPVMVPGEPALPAAPGSPPPIVAGDPPPVPPAAEPVVVAPARRILPEPIEEPAPVPEPVPVGGPPGTGEPAVPPPTGGGAGGGGGAAGTGQFINGVQIPLLTTQGAGGMARQALSYLRSVTGGWVPADIAALWEAMARQIEILHAPDWQSVPYVGQNGELVFSGSGFGVNGLVIRPNGQVLTIPSQATITLDPTGLGKVIVVYP